MREYQSVSIRMPNGDMRVAEITSATKNGYRSARVNTWFGKIRGRVTARHGFSDGRILGFEVKAADASCFFDEDTYVKAA